MQSTIKAWPTDGAFHALKAVLRAVNTADVSIEYSLDGVVQGKHVGQPTCLVFDIHETETCDGLGANFVNSPLYLIINLQVGHTVCGRRTER